MKKYIKYILIVFVFTLPFNIIFCQTIKQKFKIEKIKYVNENGFVNVTFNLVNITNDTLYLSDKNLDIRLIKNHKLIKWDYPKFDVQPFIKPVLKDGTSIYENNLEIPIQEIIKDKLANHFANKLFLKSLVSPFKSIISCFIFHIFTIK